MHQDAASLLPADAGTHPAPAFPRAYLEFFELFNAGRFFEAHEVLEPLWLSVRGAPEARFYQGLIQLAGAFVHFRHGRRQPGLALLRLGRRKLADYPATHLGLDLRRVRRQVDEWLVKAAHPASPPLSPGPPRLEPPNPTRRPGQGTPTGAAH